MRVAVCGNAQKDKKAMVKYIGQYCSEQLWDCRIDEYDSGEELLSGAARKRYHIIFLDLYSTGADGVKCAGAIRKTDDSVVIVFITSIDNYFEEGYELGVKSYIEKPIEESSVRSCLRRSAKYIRELKQTLEIMAENTPVKIALHDIQYIESIRNVSLIHTDQFLIRTGATLDELERQLGSRKFLRTHQGYLVNMDAIDRADENTFYIKNGDRIPIGVSGKGNILGRYSEYMSEGHKR